MLSKQSTMAENMTLDKKDECAVIDLLILRKYGKCYNCDSPTTPLWRKSIWDCEYKCKTKHIVLCNACGLRNNKMCCHNCGGTYIPTKNKLKFCNVCQKELS